ncbi:MAG: Rieske 2Fe-2S domain-containing protein [Pseudobdellovibrio sp.]
MKNRILLEPELIEQNLLNLSKNQTLTSGEYNFGSHCSVNDLDWNHMDWNHRPHIHNTYGNSVRIYAEPNFSLSLTQIKFMGFRFFVQVSDVKLGKGSFYQCYTVLGLFYIHGILQNREVDTTFKWYILSHKFLKPIHSLLSKRLFNLNHVQIAEDVPLRTRRRDLSAAGYSFPPDERDYVTSNDGKYRTQYPLIKKSSHHDLSGLGPGQMTEVSLDSFQFIILKIDSENIKIWSKVCPHEGGPLAIDKKCGHDEISCPWHGLKIKGVPVSNTSVYQFGATFEFAGNTLFINKN